MRYICKHCGKSHLLRDVEGGLRKHLQQGKWHSGVHDYTCPGSHTHDYYPSSGHLWSERAVFEAVYAGVMSDPLPIDPQFKSQPYVHCNDCGKYIRLKTNGTLLLHKGVAPEDNPQGWCVGTNTDNYKEKGETVARGSNALNQAQLLRAQADRIELEELERLAVLQQFGSDEDYPHLTVLAFEMQYPSWGSYRFTYVALKIVAGSSNQSRWYLTGKTSGAGNGNGYMSFDRLVEDYLSKAVGNIAYVTEWTEL